MKYRIGRKQKLALLLCEGSKQLAMFNKGQEELAQLVCYLLNNNTSNQMVVPLSEQKNNTFINFTSN